MIFFLCCCFLFKLFETRGLPPLPPLLGTCKAASIDHDSDDSARIWKGSDVFFEILCILGQADAEGDADAPDMPRSYSCLGPL